ncbi:hypothetical protein HNY73_017784 [Argiope bruennichi]|uniref:Uncharacterized protein n=1 Tax=Argiope bruennichi TaxID=94029 RepID=A0A8T0EBV2_ARGBR|nr:hypothetical protein HNY73_017784 [Argiope bruennichi]
MRRRTLVEWSTLKLSVSIRIVKLSSPSTAAKSAWLPKSYGRPLPGLSSNGVARFETGKPFLHRLSLILSSQKSSLRWRNDLLLSILSQSSIA